MKKKMEDVNLLVKELDTLKQQQQQTAQERDSLKVCETNVESLADIGAKVALSPVVQSTISANPELIL